MSQRYDCENCAGTGETRWGRCFPCKGRGSFASSPERRAKVQRKRLTSRRAGAQQENRNKAIYLGVMNRAHHDPLFVQMRVDHDQGRQWTPAQITTAREKLRGISETKRLLQEIPRTA